MKSAIVLLLCAAAGKASLTSCGESEVCSCQSGPCQFICDSEDECKESELKCGGSSCHIDCIAEDSCKKGHVECTSGRCHIKCSAKDACRDLRPLPANGPEAAYGMFCSDSASECKTICDGEDSCRASKHRCASKKCILDCINVESCKDTEYECNSGDCTIACKGAESCKDFSLTCPDDTSKTCHLICEGSESCRNMDSSKFSGSSLTVDCRTDNNACHPDLLAYAEKRTPSPTRDWTGCKVFNPITDAGALFCKSVCFSKDPTAVAQCNSNCRCDECTDWKPIVTGGPVTDLWCYLLCNNPITEPQLCFDFCTCHGSTPTPLPGSISCSKRSTCQCSGSDDCRINCDGLEECERSNLRCSSGSCSATCSGMKSCYKSSIDCNNANNCNIDCSGYLACRELKAIPDLVFEREAEPLRMLEKKEKKKKDLIPTISKPAIRCGSKARGCDIGCTGMLACQDVPMKCDGSNKCDLTCSQTLSCESAHHECIGGSCKAQCSGYKGCENAVFGWGSGGSAVLECTQTLSCAGADIECPRGHDCIVKCDGWLACQGMRLRCPEAASGQKCEIHCTHDRACADMFKTTQFTGHITSVVCDGWRACEDDLLNYKPSIPATPAPTTLSCDYWVPTDAGSWSGFTHSLCDTMCNTTDVLKDICTAANNVVQLCECGAPDSTNNPKPAYPTCFEWGKAAGLSVVSWATMPVIPLDWCKAQCDRNDTSTVCQSGLSICECKHQRPQQAASCSSGACTCSSNNCLMQCDMHQECKDITKECASGSAFCAMECSGFESCKDGASTCVGNRCAVTCSGYASCTGKAAAAGTALDCKASEQCRATCSGVNSCKGIAAKCDTTSNCRLDCSSKNSCEDMVHTCVGGAGHTGVATCTGYESCKFSQFKWSGCGATVIKCTDRRSCENAKFECPEGHSCRIECEGEESCKDVELKCPLSLPSNVLCEIRCLGVRSCLNVDRNKVSGAVTATCTGHEACNHDLSSAVPTSCLEYVALDASSNVDCNFICTNPSTDAVCKESPPAGVTRLCRCKVQAPPEPSCGLWVPTAYGQSIGSSSSLKCSQWCVNPLTDSVCSYDGTTKSHRICGIWNLTPRGEQQNVTTSWCDANCYAPGTTVLHAACSSSSGDDQHCTCADPAVTPLCQCEVPTPAPTPVPGQSVKSIVRKIFRSFMRRLMRWFQREKFMSAMLGLLQGFVRKCTVYWVCPASACNPTCPRTRTQKMARGCTSGALLMARDATVMQADNSYVEYGFEYDSGKTAQQVEEKLTTEIEAAKTNNNSALAEFGMEGVQQEETEVLVAASNDDDGFPGWAIAVIVICCLFCIVIAAGIVWKLASSSSSYPEAPATENKKSEPSADAEDPHASPSGTNEPVVDESSSLKKTERPPWK